MVLLYKQYWVHSVGYSHPIKTFTYIIGTTTITVPEEVTTYTTLIADVQDVHDESSDFELPDTVVA